MEPLPKGGDLPWALFYPASYEVGSANLGMHHVYRALRRSGVGVERFFLGPQSPYRSVESDTLLERFSIISAGIAYENDVWSLMAWLQGASIPLSWKERGQCRGAPLVGVGGSLTSINPLSLFALCDFIVLGDGEVSLADVVARLRRGGGRREEQWEALSELPYVLVPPLWGRKGAPSSGPGKARALEPQNAASAWVTPRCTFGKTLLVELQRGCRRGCRFCTLPRCFTPLRRLPFPEALSLLEEAARGTPFDQVGLITPEAGDYPEIRGLLEQLTALRKSVSFASLRLDSLDAFMVDSLHRGGRTALTLAPEAGTEALRRSCGKPFTDELILQKARLAAERGLRQAKLYFMLGLPGEEEEDVAGMASLTESLLQETRLSLVLSVNPFVPKPGTPWGEEAFLSAEVYERRTSFLRESLLSRGRRRRISFRFASHREAALEYALGWSSSEDSEETLDRFLAGERAPTPPRRDQARKELEGLGFCRSPHRENPADHGRCFP